MSSRERETSNQLKTDITEEDIPLGVMRLCALVGNYDLLSEWLHQNNFRLAEPLRPPSPISRQIFNQLLHEDPSLLEAQLEKVRRGKITQSGIVVGRIAEVSRHPNADRLWVAQVDTGEEELRQIVHGGTRSLKPDDFVAVALPGAQLSNGQRLRARNWRGVRSNGMLCSWVEIGRDPDQLIHAGDEVAVFTSVKKGKDLSLRSPSFHPRSVIGEKLKPGTPFTIR